MTASPRHTLPYEQPSPLSEMDSVYLTIAESTALYTGEEFLHEVAATISRALDASTVFIIEIINDVHRVRSLVGFSDGEFMSSEEFGLGDSPGANILRHGRSVHVRGVQDAFPTNHWLKARRADAEAGVLLYSRSGDPIGMVGLVNDAPLPDIEAYADLLERLAPRIGAELERRQRDIALRRSEARFRLLIEHSSDIMFYYRLQPDERFEYISPAVTKMVGWPPEAFFADAQLAIEVLDPEYRPLVLNAITTGSEEPIVARTTFAGGKAAWVEYRNFAFRNDEDNVIAVGGTIRDVTDRVQAEEDLARSERYRRTLLEAVPDTIFRLDIDGQVLDYVPGEALTSVMASEPGGRHQGIADLVPLAYVAPARRIIQDAVRSGQVQRFEFESNAGGESRSYEARCIPFGDREVLLIVRDFTAMKWHAGEADRMRLRDELDVKVEDKMRVRNPYGLTYRELAVLHLVAEGSADKQIAEALGISIYTANKHVGNILGKMNAASRTEAGVRALREGLLG